MVREGKHGVGGVPEVERRNGRGEVQNLCKREAVAEFHPQARPFRVVGAHVGYPSNDQHEVKFTVNFSWVCTIIFKFVARKTRHWFLAEKSIQIQHIEPIELLGVNDEKLRHIQRYFPKIRLVARGDIIKVIGGEEEIRLFEKELNNLIDAYYREGLLSIPVIDRYLQPGGRDKEMGDPSGKHEHSDVILFGVNGSMIRARTPGQRSMVHLLDNHDILFAIGPAGTGKTYTAVALAVRAWKNREVKRIILTRPAVEAGENLGFLPGDMKEKLDPYMQPLYDSLHDMIPTEKLHQLIESRTIQIAPLAFMRGRTLDHAFVILDEAQNTTELQMKMFLTRMGNHAKFIITGDITQIDLPNRQPSGLIQAMHVLKKIKGIRFIHLGKEDVVRHPLVKEILDSYRQHESGKT